MLWIYVLIAIFFVIFLAIIVPIKVELKDIIIPSVNKIKKYKSQSVIQNSYFKIKIFRIIPILKIDLDKIKKKNDTKKLYKNLTNDPIEMVINAVFNILDKAITGQKINKALLKPREIRNIIRNIDFQKLHLDIGFNFLNVILNAYISAFLNATLNMFISKNINRFNLNDLRYKTYISGEVYNIKIDGIFNIKLANIIGIIIKIIFKLRKVEKKNGRNKTSNRRFNDDGNDISREYGRC